MFKSYAVEFLCLIFSYKKCDKANKTKLVNKNLQIFH